MHVAKHAVGKPKTLLKQVPISSENQYSVTTSPTWRGTDELHKGQVKCEVRNLKVKCLQYIDWYAKHILQ